MIRLAFVILALVGCGGGAQTVRVPAFVPAIEQATLVDERTTSTYELDLGGEISKSKTIHHRRSHRRVLEVAGSLVVRMVVRYEIDESTSIDSEGHESKAAGPLAGKSYEVWRETDALEAKHADGSPITSGERGELNKAFASMGTTSRWEAFLTEREWTRDQAVEVPQDVLEEFPLREGDELRTATFAWTGSDGAAATFRGTYAYTTAEGFDMQLTLQQRVDRVTGIELGNSYVAIVHGKVEAYPFIQTVESTLTFEAE